MLAEQLTQLPKMLETNWFQIFSVIANSTILIVVANLVRKFSRLELKVEMMWAVFSKRFGIKDEE